MLGVAPSFLRETQERLTEAERSHDKWAMERKAREVAALRLADARNGVRELERVGSRMVEDPAAAEEASQPLKTRSTFPRTGPMRSVVEVVMPARRRVSGERNHIGTLTHAGGQRSCQVLVDDEDEEASPEGEVHIHPDPCSKCADLKIPCHGEPGRSCDKCVITKVACEKSSKGRKKAAEVKRKRLGMVRSIGHLLFH